MATYLNPYTDFGFKKLFGEEASKDLLTDFLNQLLPTHHQIAELQLQNGEFLGDSSMERRAFFDIHCTAVNGERFIVEMQKAKVHYFKDRALFYTTFPIRQQAKQGEWNFHLSPIYFIAILDFYYDEHEERAKFRRDVVLKDQDGEVFFDKLHFKFLQMPAFQKAEHELHTHFDKWCYFLKHLSTLESIPQVLREPVFEKAFATAELANLTGEQQEAYEKSRLMYLEVKNVYQTGWDEGMEVGVEKGIEIGVEKGTTKGTINALLVLVTAKFGQQPESVAIAMAQLLERVGVEQLTQRVLKAQQVSDVLQPDV